ncbi:MAG: dihydropteroate synthase [Rikenellaceae bacterium]|nr:dihydropteroate synthase [Rikenellaceae bacterium]
MAIINVTDDSFFEGSRTVDEQSIASRVREAIASGATILDVGGYSSRPGAKELSVDEEWERVRKGLRSIKDVAADAFVSVDTFRSEVVRRAVEEFGDVIVNDISAGELDDEMIDVVAKYNLPYIAMHMRGTPQTMQSLTEYPNGVVEEVCRYFEKKVAELHSRGVSKIILDPGFGFAKTLEQNYELLGGLNRLCAMGYPVLAGVSRKSMIYKLLGVTPAESLNGTTALNWEALRQGAAILRVHDTREAVEVVNIFTEYKKRLSV